MTKPEFRKEFWDYGKILSRGKLFNFVVGQRGGGKSFGCKRLAINRYLARKELFVYVRRDADELDTAVVKFFPDIKDFYPEHTFSVCRVTKQLWGFFCDGEPMGYGAALSTSQKLKSASFEGVTLIIFDEFIKEKGRTGYLKNEVRTFLGLYDTIGRLRDPLVLFTANAVTIANPYFIYFNIRPIAGSKFQKFRYSKQEAKKLKRPELENKEKDICVEYFVSEAYTALRNETRFGQLILGTEYGDYATDNEFQDNDSFIEKMTGKCIPWCNFIYLDERMGLWYNNEKGLLYVNKTAAPDGCRQFCFDTADQGPNVMFIKSCKRLPIIKEIETAFEYNQIRYSDAMIKALFYEIMSYS